MTDVRKKNGDEKGLPQTNTVICHQILLLHFIEITLDIRLWQTWRNLYIRVKKLQITQNQIKPTQIVSTLQTHY